MRRLEKKIIETMNKNFKIKNNYKQKITLYINNLSYFKLSH